MTDCIFCKIIAGNIPSEKVFESESIFAFRDIHPQAPTHILVIPKTHIEKLSDTSEEHSSLLSQLLLSVSNLAKDLQLSSSGYRVVINCGESAGQTVWHLHAHLLAGRPFTWPPG